MLMLFVLCLFIDFNFFHRTPGPKRAASEGAEDPTPKCRRKILPLEEKVNLLDCLQNDMSLITIGKKYGISKSLLQSIKKREEVIRKLFVSSTPVSAKTVS